MTTTHAKARTTQPAARTTSGMALALLGHRRLTREGGDPWVARLDYGGQVRRAMTALLVVFPAVCVGCGHEGSIARSATAPTAPVLDPWVRHQRSSAKTLEIAALTLATGVTAGAFGGGLIGTGVAVGPPSGEPPFWIGVVTVFIGITATTVGLVALSVAGVQYAAGD